jgi:uncharacterized RDD family membrane protein YckC
MPCPLCGDICRCPTAAHSAAAPRWLSDTNSCSVAATPPVAQAAPEAEKVSGPPAESSTPPSDNTSESAPEDSTTWRQEVAARLNRYQARRKPRPPRYPSLRLRFDEDGSARDVSNISAKSQAYQQRIATASNQALALDGFADSAVEALDIPESTPMPANQTPEQTTAVPVAAESPQPAPPAKAAAIGAVTAKIIEFPRSWTPAPPPLDELAEPVMDRDRPRILEAPEVVPPLPALGGITIEPAQQPEMEKRPGIDIPLQSAPLRRRILASVIDGVILAVACALFAYIFWKMTATAIQPLRFQMIGVAAGLAGVFWAAYQYLLVVYSGATPGLLLARLQLARFDGSPAGRRLRRWRVLASYLSAVSLGMGYAWVFLDEDSLCWHDRITHTYLAPKGHAATPRI